MITSDSLVAYYQKQPPAMQGALRAFWRGVCLSDHPTAPAFRMALGHIHHELGHSHA